MDKTRSTHKNWLMVLLLTIISSLLPVMEVQAQEGDFDNPSQAFTWYSKGQGCIHFKLEITAINPYRTLKDAKFGVRDENGKVTEAFFINEFNSSYSGFVMSYFTNLNPNKSLLYLTNDTKWTPLCYISGGDKQEHHHTRVNKETGYAELDWYYPAELAGKKCTFYVDGLVFAETRGVVNYKKDIGTIEFESVNLEFYDMIPGSESADAGTVKLPISSNRIVNWIEAEYTDEDDKVKQVGRTTFEKDSYFGYLKLPATEEHKDLKIRALIQMGKPAEGNVPNPSWPKVFTDTIVKTLAVSGDAVLHNPRMLRADMLTDVRKPNSFREQGSVLLRWKVKDPKYKDIMEGDAFVVQRSLTGKMEDFQSIANVNFDSSLENYEYNDSLLIDDLKPEQIDKELGIPLVRYRVLRGSTLKLWALEKNSTVAYAQPQIATLSHLKFINAKAAWSNETQHQVKVTWDYAENDQSHVYVYDSRAEYMLRINMYDRNNTLVDSLKTVLTYDQLKSRLLDFTLTRSCVKYTMSLEVNRKESPIGAGTAKLFKLINNETDYQNFVNNSRLSSDKAEARPHAILGADIKVTPTQAKDVLGYDQSNAFTGNFNGNGHKLTVAWPSNDAFSNFQYLSPIVFAGNGGVICNLITAGTTTQTKPYSGGIVGTISTGALFIENCTSQLLFDVKLSDDASSGGILGIMDQNEGTDNSKNLHISNCLFNGQINATLATSFGGFVGWRRYNLLAVISNSYYHPKSVETKKKEGSATFIRYSTLNHEYQIIQDCKFYESLGLEQGTKSTKSPDNWCWKDESPAIVQKQFSTPTGDSKFNVELPSDQLYFENLGRIDTKSLTVQSLQSSTLLRWNNVSNDQPVDYYEVWRSDVKEDKFQVIATQLTEMVYEDKTTSPVRSYKYYVRGVNDCEGKKYEDTETVEGHCIQTGEASGYLRFSDGTGIPGQTIIFAGNGINAETTTDESGYFCKSGLPYVNGTETTYKVSVKLNGFDGMQSVTFKTLPGENRVTGIEFLVTKSVKFSGYVQYSGTSIPVQGVSFLVDGREMHSSEGKVVSDHEGKFSFRMLEGDHTIQAVKEGHTFYQKGYYHENNDVNQLAHHFDNGVDKAGIFFYDDTRVKLIGRVAGGKDQGALPLDNSLSRNNLGDDLQMILTLEGDNKSRLVWDILDRNKKERDTIFHHQRHDKKYEYKTQVHTTQNRMVVKPDVHTGEYQVWLPPVKWKIQQITAKGYATLFQDGKTGDVIDLSDSLTLHTNHVTGQWEAADKSNVTSVDVSYHAIYNRIYHSPVLIDYRQDGTQNYEYLGDQKYTAMNLAGYKSEVPLCYPVRKEGWPKGKADSLQAKYTFQYPVFDGMKTYKLHLSAVEKYFYNNNIQSDTTDIVKLSGGVVTVQNGMESMTHREEVPLNDKGEGTVTLKIKQVPYLLTSKDALRTVTITLLMDGTRYEAEPIRAYILNTYKQSGAKDYMTVKVPQLIDVLRDPPGGGSSAKLSKGSTLKYGYSLDWAAKGGLDIKLSFGNVLNQFIGAGIWAPGALSFTGTDIGATSYLTLDVNLVINASGKQAYSYTATTTEDISTSSDKMMVGADADVYIGTETTIAMTPAVAVRAIPDSMWVQLQGEREAGRMIEIAKGTDKNGGLLHLVRDEIVTIGPKAINTTFAHSQSYIIKQLIPKLEQECKSLLFTGTKEEAQALANKTGKVVYWSLRSHDDPNYGVVNTKQKVAMGDQSWEYYFNTTIDKAQDGINYMIVRPASGTNSLSTEDRIADFGQSILGWASMIAQNEREKLEATDLVKTFDIDGGVPLNYAEDFSSDYSVSAMLQMPWENTLLSVPGILSGAMKALGNKLSSSNKKDNYFGTEMWGAKFQFSMSPVAEYSVKTPYDKETKFSRKESFTISMDKKSHLIVDVYRTKSKVDNVAADKNGVLDVFVNQNYNSQLSTVENKITHWTSYGGLDALNKSQLTYSKSFVYRTRGGATCRPYEDERVTHFYQKGSQLDVRTKKIENPIITMDKQSLSGVPFGDPARFKLYLANESEQPEAAYPYFNLSLVENYNPKGAKLMLDGMPLTGNERTVEIEPGKVTEKTLEVWAAEDFDYENLRLRLESQNDINTYQDAQFSVHFMQTAGNVEISTPDDKWIMNTDAPYEKNKGWYLPVVISGFNKNQNNFDHIEFQYKETTRGDDYWTNLCGFYADSVAYLRASGTKEMIPKNGNIVTRFFGEGVEMEKGYDLRAVLFCRNGNGFLTNSSKILSGVKDTRRPKLFGIPDPKDGVLGVGDNISFNFSEDIEYNYLQETTNFEVKGETNETAIAEEPSLQFTGKGYAESEARRNFSDKNITIEVMIKPDSTGLPMPIFSHGRDGKQLQLWLTKDKHLKAVVDGRELVSPKVFSALGYQRVALVLDHDAKRLSIISNDVEATMENVTYNGYGPVIFGSTNQTDVSARSFYKGRMLQGRVWNRTMDLILLNAYGNQLLTGYEMGLTDYYPMNDGRGNYATDLAQGAHLKLNGASWALPRGMSLYIDKNEQRTIKGYEIRDKYINRLAEKDYTLMFWFKTDAEGRGTLLANGSGRKTDVNAIDKFFIGFEGETLKYRSYGNEYTLGNTYSDGSWHHYAMTVNRSHQVASIYVDNSLKAQFPTDSLGGMTGKTYFGNMVWQEEGSANDVVHQQNAYTGFIDGFVLFEQALPQNLIKRYSTRSLNGAEKGLITNVNFSRQERQKNGDLTLQPFGKNLLLVTDDKGKTTQKTDSVFVDAVSVIMNHINQNVGAPVQPYEELRNLNFSYVGRDNQILVNIDELDSRINKRTVYVTVSDIPDMNGNTTASPATMAVFVDRNPLRWKQKSYITTLGPTYNSDYMFDIDIENNSGAPHTYKLDNLPKWLVASKTTDVIDPKGEQTLTFTISKDTNVGNYDNIIYLTDENGLSEPLTLNITIEGQMPEWSVDSSIKQFSMSIVGQVQIGGEIVTDSRDIVGVFDNTGRCMGVGNVNYESLSGESLVYLTVYDSMTVARPLNFKLWHYETGKTMVLTPSENVQFKPETFKGTTKSPLVLSAGTQYIQTIELEPGWNWVSLNVINNDYRNVRKLLSWFDWKEGDMLTDENNNLSLMYHLKQWMSNKGSESLDNIMLSVSHSYRIKVGNAVCVELTGNAIKTEGDRTIAVKPGWNSIGYTPMVNLPLATALSDYLDDAVDGDVVKSKTEFAMFTEGANGSGEWKGNLKYMKPGEGYMLYRKKQSDVKFIYPYYEPTETFASNTSNRAPMVADYANNMTVTAVAEGVEMHDGDRLIAYAGAEMRGATEVTAYLSPQQSRLFFINIQGDKAEHLSFAIERDGEIIATTGEVMTYEANGRSGSPDVPTKINFVKSDQLPQHGWYTLQGIKLDKQPTQSGVYIYNGRKQVIR